MLSHWCSRTQRAMGHERKRDRLKAEAR
jgi:hypothetical protein